MSEDFASKLALGTAQFGLNYGVTNRAGQTPPDEVASILSVARNAGINHLDTAIAYGNSETVLGKSDSEDFQIITKLPHAEFSELPISSWVENHLEQSLSRLQRNSIYALLLHDSKLLAAKNGDIIFDTLVRIKERGKVQKIGWSVYSPQDLDQVPERLIPDLVQFPFNAFDQRMLNSGWLDRLKVQNVEIHARSIFLQGLLLLTFCERPDWSLAHRSVWEEWDDYLQSNQLDPITACMSNALSTDKIDKLVLGVNSVSQLEQLLEVKPDMNIPAFSPTRTAPRALIDPRLWN